MTDVASTLERIESLITRIQEQCETLEGIEKDNRLLSLEITRRNVERAEELHAAQLNIIRSQVTLVDDAKSMVGERGGESEGM